MEKTNEKSEDDIIITHHPSSSNDDVGTSNNNDDQKIGKRRVRIKNIHKWLVESDLCKAFQDTLCLSPYVLISHQTN